MHRQGHAGTVKMWVHPGRSEVPDTLAPWHPDNLAPCHLGVTPEEGVADAEEPDNQRRITLLVSAEAFHSF